MQDRFLKLADEKKERMVMAGIREFAVHAYAEASTERITEYSGISKGLLFHYFGNKSAFYLYCLEETIRRLSQSEPVVDVAQSNLYLQDNQSFYDMVFRKLENHMQSLVAFPTEHRFLKTAERETHSAVCEAKDRMLNHYQAAVKLAAETNYQKALSRLKLKRVGDRILMEGLLMYVTAIQDRYLEEYGEEPEQFLKNREWIKYEMTTYLNLMLEGIRR